MEALYRPPHACYLEQRAFTREGWRWIGWSDTAILDARGEVKEIIGVGRDINRHRYSAAELDAAVRVASEDDPHLHAERIAELRERVRRREAAAYEKYNGQFLGVERVLAAKHTDGPSTREPRRTPRDVISARNPHRRAEAIHEHQAWLRWHGDAKRRWQAGETDVLFPPGTYWMKHHTSARVMKPPEPPP